MKKQKPSLHAKLLRGHPKQVMLRGVPKWEVDAGVCGGKRVRRRFDTLPEAVEFQKHAKLQYIQMGDAFDILPVNKRAELLLTVQEMEKAGTSLLEVWADYCKRHKGIHLALGEAADKWTANLRERGLRPTYVLESTKFARRMVEHFGTDYALGDLNADDLDAWIKQLTPGGALDRYKRTRTICGFFHKKGWVLSNPSIPLDAPSRYIRKPLVLGNDTVKQIMSCVFGTYKELAPYYILALFTGIRGAEIQRLTWDSINTETKQVRVEIEDSKTSRRRVVHMLNNTAPILNGFREYPLWSPTHWKKIHEIRKVLNHPYKVDCLRHTAATHLTNYYESFDKAAMELGNSPNILRTTYYGIATPEESKEFFEIL